MEFALMFDKLFDFLNMAAQVFASQVCLWGTCISSFLHVFTIEGVSVFLSKWVCQDPPENFFAWKAKADTILCISVHWKSKSVLIKCSIQCCFPGTFISFHSLQDDVSIEKQSMRFIADVPRCLRAWVFFKNSATHSPSQRGRTEKNLHSAFNSSRVCLRFIMFGIIQAEARETGAEVEGAAEGYDFQRIIF